MEKSIKMHTETYDIVKKIAETDKRSLTTTLDIIVEYYKENCYDKQDT